MKAIILAGGHGSRLLPLTENKNKTMVELNGRPIIDYIINSIEKSGIKDITIVANRFIDDISPNNVDSDRDKFFKDMEKNWDYQEVYKNYLEVRLDVYSNINKLYDDNSDCIVSGDQEISTEQVKEAEKDLSDFISKYEN